MTKISPTQLKTVFGGTTSSTNDQITQQLTALQSSIKDIASAPNNNNNSSMMMMAMMMAMRPQTNVVAAGGPPPGVGGAPGPVVNISTRVRR